MNDRFLTRFLTPFYMPLQFSGTLEEEFEDTEGNILNRRTYEDLARQGLL